MLTIKMKDGTFLFGLDGENLKRLRAGDPLLLDFEKWGGKGKALVFLSETKEEVHAQMSEFLGQELPPIGVALMVNIPRDTH